MPLYLGRFKYSAEAIKAMIENPHDRGAVATEVAESLGCKLHGIWWAFGEHDGVFLLEAPDNVAVVALAMAVGASGQISTEDHRAPRHERSTGRHAQGGDRDVPPTELTGAVKQDLSGERLAGQVAVGVHGPIEETICAGIAKLGGCLNQCTERVIRERAPDRHPAHSRLGELGDRRQSRHDENVDRAVHGIQNRPNLLHAAQRWREKHVRPGLL